MLTLTFLGVGSAFAKRHYQSNALVEAWQSGPDQQVTPDETLLIDFGGTGPMALHHLKDQPGFAYLNRDERIFYPAIRNVLVTHLHGDHIGGLEELASLNYFRFRVPTTGRGYRPRIISTEVILANLWEQSLRGGLGVISPRRASLSDYFQPHAAPAVFRNPGPAFTLVDRYAISLFPTDHIRIQQKYDWPSVGVLLCDRKTNQTVVFSGDTRFDPDGIGSLIASASQVFHDVQLEPFPEPVHALWSELRTLPTESRRKMILYHYGDEWRDPAFESVADEFAGFAVPQVRYPLFP